MFRYRNKYRPYGVLNRQQGGTSAPSPLLTDLVSYWKLDEVSGTRIDSHGSNNLTETGNVTSVTGKIGNAAKTTSTDTLETGSTVNIGTSDFTISLWNLRVSILSVDFVNNFNFSASGYFYIRVASSSRYAAYIGEGTNVISTVEPVGSATGVWRHIVVTFDRDGNLSLYVDNTLQDAANISTLAGANINITIKLQEPSEIDELGVWKRLLTPAEIAQLWNSGSGLTYPF